MSSAKSVHPLTNTYQGRGFEAGLHLNTGCADWTPTSLGANLTDQLAAFRAKYGSVRAPDTNRTHCIVWSDWSTQASLQTAQGYYGAFTAKAHTDQATTYDSDQVPASALRHNVPIISGHQRLTWLDGRNASSYSNIAGSGGNLTFSVDVGTGANGLTGMVPTAGPGGRTLSTLARAGGAVPFTRTTIKGVEYAMFTAASGAYTAGYVAAAAATVTASAAAEAGGTTASVTVATSSAAKTVIGYGTQPTALTRTAVDGTQSSKRTVQLAGLAPPPPAGTGRR